MGSLEREQTVMKKMSWNPSKQWHDFLKSSCYEKICKIVWFFIYCLLISFSVLQTISVFISNDSNEWRDTYMAFMALIPIFLFICILNDRWSIPVTLLGAESLLLGIIALLAPYPAVHMMADIRDVFLRIVLFLYLLITPLVFRFHKKSTLIQKNEREFEEKKKKLGWGQWLLWHIGNNLDHKNTGDFLLDDRNMLYCKEFCEILKENQKDYEYELLEDRIKTQRNNMYFPFFKYIVKKSDMKTELLKVPLKNRIEKRKEIEKKQFENILSTLVSLNQERMDVSWNYNGETYFGFFDSKEQKVSLSKGQDISVLLNHESYPNEVKQVQSHTSDWSKHNYITITYSDNERISYRITKDLPLLCPNLSIIMICGMPINGWTSWSYNKTGRIDNYKKLSYLDFISS